MTPRALHYRWVIFRRWMMLGSAVLIGSALVALVIGSNRAGAAPPDTLAPPPLPAPAPARLASTAQISASTCPRDITVVFDSSGSMGYDPVCKGCWYKTNTDLNDIPPAGGSYPYYYTYPKNGEYRTIVSTTVTSSLCTVDPPQSISYSERLYQIIEAELYYRNTSIIDTRFRETGKGYWALQRDGSGAARFNNDSSEPGTYISHHPERTFYPTSPFVMPYGRFYTQGDAESGAAPRVEYQFSFNPSESWGTQAQVWIRARRGDYGLDNSLNTNNGTIYWALDRGGSQLVWPPQTNTYVEGRSGWQMVYLTTIDSIQYGTVYTLKLYAGSSGYDIDRIFITNNSSVPSTVQTNRSGTPGSARGQACDICNPIFGETVTEDMCAGFYPVYTTTNNLSSPIWADEHQPIRTSKEAIKNFIERLDPAFDQVSFVTYTGNNSSETKIAAELSCLQASRRQGIDCYEGTNPISYTYVLREIERVEPQNLTCIACGMRLGLQALGFNTDDDPNFDNSCDGSSGSHCGRGGGANKVLILITDGVPNHAPIGVTCDPLTVGGVTYNNHYSNSSYDCVLNYAEMAANKGITLYTIGLGFGVDGEFLTQAAELGNGQYYVIPSPQDLDLVFDEIISTTTAACSPQNLILAKSATPAEGLQVGDIITYSLSFSNSGDLATTNVVLTDRLPINTQFVTASGGFTPPAPVSGDVITWTLGQLEGGATGVQSLTVVISPTQPGDVITNVAGIYGDQAHGQATLVISFTLPAEDGSRPIYLPIILKSSEVWTQQ